jgi:hypothetical protein
MGPGRHVTLRALAGISQHDQPGLIADGRLQHGIKVVEKSPRHNQHGSAELIQSHEHLLRGLRLRYNAHFVFHSQHFGNARAKNGLVIGQN